jgi:hypothetical protein
MAGRSVHGHEAACRIDVIEGDDEIANDIAPHDLEYRVDHEERRDRIGVVTQASQQRERDHLHYRTHHQRLYSPEPQSQPSRGA